MPPDDFVSKADYERIVKLFQRCQRIAFALLVAGAGKAVFVLLSEPAGSLPWWLGVVELTICTTTSAYLAAPYGDRLRDLFDLTKSS